MIKTYSANVSIYFDALQKCFKNDEKNNFEKAKGFVFDNYSQKVLKYLFISTAFWFSIFGSLLLFSLYGHNVTNIFVIIFFAGSLLTHIPAGVAM